MRAKLLVAKVNMKNQSTYLEYSTAKILQVTSVSIYQQNHVYNVRAMLSLVKSILVR